MLPYTKFCLWGRTAWIVKSIVPYVLLYEGRGEEELKYIGRTEVLLPSNLLGYIALLIYRELLCHFSLTQSV